MFEQELETLMESEAEFEAELESELEGEGEFEASHEFEQEVGPGAGFHETEYELNPVRRVYLDAMLEMEHFAAMAAESESEQEAEQFFPLLLPLAAKALPFIAKAGAKFIPKLVGKFAPKAGKLLARNRNVINQGIRSIGRSLIRQGRGQLTRTMPTIVRRTVGQVYNQAARGRQMSPEEIRRLLFAQARRVINDPASRQRAMRISQAADQLYHRRLQGSGGARGVATRSSRRCGCRCCCCR